MQNAQMYNPDRHCSNPPDTQVSRSVGTRWQCFWLPGRHKSRSFLEEDNWIPEPTKSDYIQIKYCSSKHITHGRREEKLNGGNFNI